MSRNAQTGKTELKTVSTTTKHYNVPTITLTFSDGEKIVTTAPHPFYVKGKGFVPASRLDVGNSMVTRAGLAAKITKIEHTKPATVYNLTVAICHTYFVGSKNGGTWVHNADACKKIIRGSNKTIKDILKKAHGVTDEEAGNMIHNVKEDIGAGGADNVGVDHEGNLYSPTDELIGPGTDYNYPR